MINVGQTLFPAPGEADPAGPYVVVASLSQPFNAGTFSGVLTSEVLIGDTSNSLGGVTFTYRVSNSPDSQNVEARLTVNGYTGWLTDGGYQLPLTGLSPALADRQTADVCRLQLPRRAARRRTDSAGTAEHVAGHSDQCTDVDGFVCFGHRWHGRDDSDVWTGSGTGDVVVAGD